MQQLSPSSIPSSVLKRTIDQNKNENRKSVIGGIGIEQVKKNEKYYARSASQNEVQIHSKELPIDKRRSMSPKQNILISQNQLASVTAAKQKSESIEREQREKSLESKKKKIVKILAPDLVPGVETIRVLFKEKGISFETKMANGGFKTLEFLDPKTVVFREKRQEVEKSNLVQFLKKLINFDPKQVHFFDSALREQDTIELTFLRDFRSDIKNVLKGISHSYIIFGGTASGKTQASIGNIRTPGAFMLMVQEMIQQREELIEKNGGKVENIHMTMSMVSYSKNKFFDAFIPHDTPLQVRNDKFGKPYLSGICEVKISNSIEAMRTLKGGFLNMQKYQQDLYQIKQELKPLSIVLEMKCMIQNINQEGEGGEEGEEKKKKINNKIFSSLRVVKLSHQSTHMMKSFQETLNYLAEINMKENNQKKELPKSNVFINYINESLCGNSVTRIIGCVTPSVSKVNETKSTIELLEMVKQIKTNPVAVTFPDKLFQDSVKKDNLQNAVKYVEELIDQFDSNEEMTVKFHKRILKAGKVISMLQEIMEKVLSQYQLEANTKRQLNIIYQSILDNTNKIFSSCMTSTHTKEYYHARIVQYNVEAMAEFNQTYSKEIGLLLSNLAEQKDTLELLEEELEQQFKFEELRKDKQHYLLKSDVAKLVRISKHCRFLFHFFKEEKQLNLFDDSEASLLLSEVFLKIKQFNFTVQTKTEMLDNQLKKMSLNSVRAAADVIWKSKQNGSLTDRKLPPCIEMQELHQQSQLYENERQSQNYSDSFEDDTSWNELKISRNGSKDNHTSQFSLQEEERDSTVDLEKKEKQFYELQYSQQLSPTQDEEIQIGKYRDAEGKRRSCSTVRSKEDIQQKKRFIYVNNTRIPMKSKKEKKSQGLWNSVSEIFYDDLNQNITSARVQTKDDETKSLTEQSQQPQQVLNSSKFLAKDKINAADFKNKEKKEIIYQPLNEQLEFSPSKLFSNQILDVRIANENQLKLRIDQFVSNNPKAEGDNYSAPNQIYYSNLNSQSEQLLNSNQKIKMEQILSQRSKGEILFPHHNHSNSVSSSKDNTDNNNNNNNYYSQQLSPQKNVKNLIRDVLNPNFQKEIIPMKKESTILVDLPLLLKEQYSKQLKEQSNKLLPQRQLSLNCKTDSSNQTVKPAHIESKKEIQTKQHINLAQNHFLSSKILQPIDPLISQRSTKLKRERYVNSLHSMNQMEIKLESSVIQANNSKNNNNNVTQLSSTNLQALPSQNVSKYLIANKKTEESNNNSKEEVNYNFNYPYGVFTLKKSQRRLANQKPGIRESSQKLSPLKQCINPIMNDNNAHKINVPSNIQKNKAMNQQQQYSNLNSAKVVYKQIDGFKLDKSPIKKRNESQEMEKKISQKEILQFQIPSLQDTLSRRTKYTKFFLETE